MCHNGRLGREKGKIWYRVVSESFKSRSSLDELSFRGCVDFGLISHFLGCDYGKRVYANLAEKREGVHIY